MKTTKTYFLILFTVLLFTANQCQKEDLNGLPPETQKGKNTFGCYVDGELFVKMRGGPTQDPLKATYYREKNYLFLRCISFDRQYISLHIDNPQEKKNNSLRSGLYMTNYNPENISHFFLCEDCSHVFITKFDTINRIVSGTFEFMGRCAYVSRDTLTNIYCSEESTVQITKGRFDVKLNVY